MKEFWDKRYGATDFAYGTEPNVFFKACLENFKPTGTILLPAEGEGRNAVFAAKYGLDVHAFDISEAGKNKALRLASLEQTSINYQLGDFLKMDYPENSFDVAALIFSHFPPHLLANYHQKVARLVKHNGLIFLEGFSKNNLPLRAKNPAIGGPDNVEMLFSKASIKADFPNFDIVQLEEVETELNEGEYHQGIAKVIRFIGKKKSGS